MLKRYLLLICVGLILAGCDDSPAPPADATKTADGKNKPPTTQELLHAPRKPLALGYIPLKLMVPPGWQVQAPGKTTMAFLQGTTPSGGEVQIQLSQRPSMTRDQIQYLIDGAKSEMAKKPEEIKSVEAKTRGELTFLERQSVGQPINLPGQELGVDTSPEYRWTISVFVPRAKDSAQYELNFLGLTQNRFNTDKNFLQTILNTLELDTAAPAVEK